MINPISHATPAQPVAEPAAARRPPPQPKVQSVAEPKDTVRISPAAKTTKQ